MGSGLMEDHGTEAHGKDAHLINVQVPPGITGVSTRKSRKWQASHCQSSRKNDYKSINI